MNESRYINITEKHSKCIKFILVIHYTFEVILFMAAFLQDRKDVDFILSGTEAHSKSLTESM